MGLDRNRTSPRRPPGAVVPALKNWPPRCVVCAWQGAPDADQSPYLACGGDPARHQRTPTAPKETP